jgi:glycosyltransferase involved in cell wall biosynthesis
MEISIVIPIMNERENLELLCSKLDSVFKNIESPVEYIFVNDGSCDDSMMVLRNLQISNPRIVAIDLSRNYGQTAALAAGIDTAKGKIIVTMDGDLQHDPIEIPLLLKKLSEGYDLVSGCRQRREDNFLARRLPSLVANWLMRKISGIELKDFGSTFKAYRSPLIKQLQLFGELHRFIPVLAHRAGARITEIPITISSRKYGSSKYGLGRIFGVFEDLFFLKFYTDYITKPIRIFGKFFFIFFILGFSISFLLLLCWTANLINRIADHEALLLFSVLLMVIGTQFLVAGILAEMLSRVYFQTNSLKIYSIREVLRTGENPSSSN